MAVQFDLSSLRGKITTSYVALVAATIVLAVLAFLDLLFVERQVREGEVVSDLKDAVSEMRREEKNLFLYTDQESLQRADLYAETSLAILLNHKKVLAAIWQISNYATTVSKLEQYRQLLNHWQGAVGNDRSGLEDDIRAIGHQIYLLVESLSGLERSMLEDAIQGSQWLLLLFLLVIGLAIFIVGRQLIRAVLMPLSKLESHLKPIAQGRFNQLQPASRDREFIAFTDAFNRMLKELEIRQRRMLQSEKLASLGILSSGVAHELNNPLSNISSSCQLLMEELQEADPDQLNRWLKQIDSETERARQIVRMLLGFGSQRVFQKVPVSLLELIEEIKMLIAKEMDIYSGRLNVNVGRDLVLVADKQRIQQLFINLIQNALHAGGQGVNILISAVVCKKGVMKLPDGAVFAGDLKCMTDSSVPVIEIVVSDDGPGISGDAISKVFDPFFTTSEPGQGVGLGLFIVQEIIKEHGGCLAIASKPGEGTKIIALLPEGDMNNE